MSDDRSTSPISVPNSQYHQLRGSLGITFTDLFARQKNPPPTSDSQATAPNAPNAEVAVGEDVESASPGATSTSPFTRRVSFSTWALKEGRAGSIGNGEVSNWTEALRSLSESASSLGGPISPQDPQPVISQPGQHQQAASVAIVEQPVRETPKQFKQKRPDFFQEKILRGDFME